jgi:hypothetical protein
MRFETLFAELPLRDEGTLLATLFEAATLLALRTPHFAPRCCFDDA